MDQILFYTFDLLNLLNVLVDIGFYSLYSYSCIIVIVLY